MDLNKKCYNSRKYFKIVNQNRKVVNAIHDRGRRTGAEVEWGSRTMFRFRFLKFILVCRIVLA